MKDVNCENTNEIKNLSIQMVGKLCPSHTDRSFFILFIKVGLGIFFAVADQIGMPVFVFSG